MKTIFIGVDVRNHSMTSSYGLNIDYGAEEKSRNYESIGSIELDGRKHKFSDSNIFKIDSIPDDIFMIYLLHLIADAMVEENVRDANINCGFGVCLNDVKLLETIETYFMRVSEIAFKYNGITMLVNLKVKVFPRPLAAYVNSFKILPVHSRINIVDIGKKSVDVITVTANKPETNTYKKLNCGLDELNHKILKRLRKRYNENICIGQVELFINGDRNAIEDDKVKRLIDREMIEIVKKLQVELQANNFELNGVLNLLTGSGANAYGGILDVLITKDLKNYIVDIDGIRSNARGLALLIEEFQRRGGNG